MVTSNELKIMRRPRYDIIADLKNLEFDEFDNFEYLLGMKISSLTKERISKLESEFDDKQKEFNILNSKTIKELWIEDLDVFVEEYKKMMEEDAKLYVRGEVKTKPGRKVKQKRSEPMATKTFTKKKTTSTDSLNRKMLTISINESDSSELDAPWKRHKYLEK